MFRFSPMIRNSKRSKIIIIIITKIKVLGHSLFPGSTVRCCVVLFCFALLCFAVDFITHLETKKEINVKLLYSSKYLATV